jgi:hypothetical protein
LFRQRLCAPVIIFCCSWEYIWFETVVLNFVLKAVYSSTVLHTRVDITCFPCKDSCSIYCMICRPPTLSTPRQSFLYYLHHAHHSVMDKNWPPCLFILDPLPRLLSQSISPIKNLHLGTQPCLFSLGHWIL